MPQSYLNLWRALNWPNRISLLRVLGVAPFVVLVLNHNEWPWARYVAMAVFVIMGLSDALDGYLARKKGQVTRLGKILDPVADKLLITCSVFLLASQRAAVEGWRLPNWVVVAVVGKDLWVVIGFLVVYLITDQVRIHPIWAGKWCTTAQLVMVVGVLAAPDLNLLADGVGTGAAYVLCWVVMAMCVVAMMGYLRLGISFLAEAGEENVKQIAQDKPANEGRSEP